jgi:hypothetical protein
MDRAANNTLFVLWLNAEVNKILERDEKNKSWILTNKSKLPTQSFLWIEDRSKKSSWHLPYREGIGDIDPNTKMYSKAGPINLNVLKAISHVMSEAKADDSITIPKEIRSKITKLLKEFDIEESNGSKKMAKMVNINEASISGQFKESTIDKENRLIPGVVLLRETSSNRYYPGSKGTRFSESFRRAVASSIDGLKFYNNHVSDDELKRNRGVRSTNDILGYYENGRIEAGVPKADIRYLTHQAEFVESLMEISDKIGLSIVANGEMSYDKETGIAEAFKLKKLFSAELVTEPGSTTNMFESDNNNIEEEEGDFMDYKDLSIQNILENRPDLVEGLEKGIMDKMSTKEEVDGFKKQITDLTESNKTLKLKVDEFEVKDKAAARAVKIDELIKESKIDAKLITPIFKETLSEAKDDEAVKKLIEDRKLLALVKKGVKGMGDHQKIDESGTDEISDEDFDKQLIEAASDRG